MKRIVFLPVVFVMMSIQLVRSAEAPALIERPASGNGPTQVSVGIWIVDINNIDSAQQNFTADIAIVLRWTDARLAHTGTGAVHYPLDQIWTPRVSIANETSSVVRKLPESAEVEPDGTVRYRPNEVVFVADENWIHDGLQKAAGISRSITLPDWTVERWDAKPDFYTLTPGLQYSAYVFEFTASRNVQHYILKVILPLILIVMMSWSVFWTEP